MCSRGIFDWAFRVRDMRVDPPLTQSDVLSLGPTGRVKIGTAGWW
jgi:hypothetical protein